MNRLMTGQQSLTNFYVSVKHEYPILAEAMRDDILLVTIYSLSADQTPAQDAAERIRKQALDLPEIYKRVLDFALTDLEFSNQSPSKEITDEP